MVEITASGAGRQEPSASLAGEASDVSAPEGESLECQKRRYGRASAEPAHVRFERAKHNPEFTPFTIDLRLARRLAGALRSRTIRNAESRCTLLSQCRHSVGFPRKLAFSEENQPEQALG